jgi:uncharacterized SAM-binding protein YcdF (DUF218 family)
LKPRIVKIVFVVIVAWALIASLAPRALVVSAPLASADAIVVLSGSSAYVERTRKAAELYREGRAPLVLLTDDNTRGGWSSAKQTNPFFVERAKEELINAGVPADRITIIPGSASSTRDEAVIVKQYVERERLRSVLIVTSSYHSRRALRTMQQVFADNGISIGLEPSSTSPTAFWWVRPQGWRTVGSEFLKTIYYWFNYD